MLRSLRHIAETIDAVMIAEGIEQVEDVIALRDLGLRYGQGYYMARPAPPFITLKDEVRAEMRSTTPNVPPASMVPNGDDDEEPTVRSGLAKQRDPAQRVRARRRDHERLQDRSRTRSARSTARIATAHEVARRLANATVAAADRRR